jgi:hypothetical protein
MERSEPRVAPSAMRLRTQRDGETKSGIAFKCCPAYESPNLRGRRLLGYGRHGRVRSHPRRVLYLRTADVVEEFVPIAEGNRPETSLIEVSTRQVPPKF